MKKTIICTVMTLLLLTVAGCAFGKSTQEITVSEEPIIATETAAETLGTITKPIVIETEPETTQAPIVMDIESMTASTESEIVNEYEDYFTEMSAAEYLCIRQIVYWESAAAVCGADCDRAVVETIMNRCLAYHASIYDVCTAPSQFVCRPIPDNAYDNVIQACDDAILYVQANGRTVLPNTDYLFFATKKQSLAQNHIWVGKTNVNGVPTPGRGMYFGERKDK